MHFTKPIVLALASLISFASAQEYLHPRALQARAFNAGYQAALMARWAEPDPYAEPDAYAEAEAEAEAGKESFIEDGGAICKRQYNECLRTHGNAPNAGRLCMEAYQGCLKHVSRNMTPGRGQRRPSD